MQVRVSKRQSRRSSGGGKDKGPIFKPDGQGQISQKIRGEFMPDKACEELTAEGIVLYNEERYAEALEKFTLAANEGCAEACYMLGEAYCNGNGVKRSGAIGSEWHEKAAKKGYIPAQMKLGIYFHFGRGNLEADKKKACYWMKKAAQVGNSEAQCWVGLFYLWGYFGKKDAKTALLWFHRAAQQNNPDGLYEIGSCYEHGEGVEKDLKKAIEWYEKAAARDSGEALCRLGHCYRYAWGVEQDIPLAVQYYESAAELDEPDAWDCLDELSAKGYMEAKEALSRLKGE